MDDLEALFPYVIGVLYFIFVASLAEETAKKRSYYKEQLQLIDDYEEQSTIKCYLKGLGGQITFGICLLVVGELCLYLFHKPLSAFANSTSPLTQPYVLTSSVGILLWILAAYLKFSRKSLRKTLEDDKRPPVLYLRPFDIDNDAIEFAVQQINLGKKLFGVANHIIGMARSLGPVIAIADPRQDENNELGIASEKFFEWQRAVATFMDDASLIIFRPYSTAGVIWEFELLVSRGHLGKTIVATMASEKIAKEYYEKYEVFKNVIIERLGINIGEPNPKAKYVYFDDNNDAWETNDYFDIPIFRKVFFRQVIHPRQFKKLKAARI
jgi:hypothetical protein